MELITTNTTKLTESEKQELQECETIIEAGLQEFVKVGNALLHIQKSKLYREGYETFKAYLQGRWSMSEQHGYRLMDAAKTVCGLKTHPEGEVSSAQQNSVADNGATGGASAGSTSTEPTSEKQLRPLTGLSPDQQKEAWTIATKDNPNPTEADVKKAVEQVKASEETAIKVKESELKIIAYLKECGAQGATSDEIEVKTGVAHQRVSDLMKQGEVVYLTDLGKRVRRKTAKAKEGVKNPTAYVIVLREFAEKVKDEPETTSKPSQPQIKSGKPAKPEDHIPAYLLGGIITEDMLVKGHAVCKDAHGDPYDLPIGVSKLQRDEEVSTMMGGGLTVAERRANYKWERYHQTKIRSKVLKVLEAINPVEVPKVLKGAAFTYQYNLGVACDLRELVEMLCADLMRQADMLETREKYAHLINSVTNSR